MTMLTLSSLKQYRVSKDVRRATIAHLTGISDDRLRNLEQRRIEPWFDEAVMITRMLNLASIDLLIEGDGAASMLVAEDAVFREADIALWRSGYRVPLSAAYRLSRHFGLMKVDDLSVPHLVRQVWEVVEKSERVAAARGIVPTCPWCLTTGDHLPTCLPHNLMGPRGQAELGEGVVGVLRPAMKGRQRHSSIAYGIRALRDAKGWKQSELAERAGVNTNYLARVERSQMPLSIEMARKLAAALGLADVAPLYARPAPGTVVDEEDEASEEELLDRADQKHEAQAGDWLADMIRDTEARSTPDISFEELKEALAGRGDMSG